jgi:predicted DCC family thiol-disulfide oxidoreductase YuxK
VQFVLRHERQQLLRFAALESDIGREVRARHPEIAGADSMIWVDDAGGPGERVLIRSSAALRIGRYMGGIWRLTAIGALVPRFVRDAAYDVIARHRHRLAPGDRCYVPPPAVRSRFI